MSSPATTAGGDMIRLTEYVSAQRDGKKRLDWNAISEILIHPHFRAALRSSVKAPIAFSLNGFDYLNPDGLMWVLLMGEVLTAERNQIVYLDLPRMQSQVAELN